MDIQPTVKVIRVLYPLVGTPDLDGTIVEAMFDQLTGNTLAAAVCDYLCLGKGPA